MQVDTQDIFGIPIANLSMEETILLIESAINNKQHIHHTVVNAGKIVSMQTDEKLAKSVLEADLINADGQAVVWSSKLLNKPLKERVAGIDLMENIIQLAHKNKYTVFFLGATKEVLNKVITEYSNKFSPEIIAGSYHGYFSPEEEESIAKKIAESKATILLVAMSSPKKEIFLAKYKTFFDKLLT